MKEFLTGLLSAIRDFIMLLVVIFVFIGTPVVFLLVARQFMSDFDALLLFIVVSWWGILIPNDLKQIGQYSTSLYNRVKGESNEKRDN